MKEMLKDMIGKMIMIWPGDTYSKYAILLDVGEQGILVKQTEETCGLSHDKEWQIRGKKRFIAYSHNLHFREV